MELVHSEYASGFDLGGPPPVPPLWSGIVRHTPSVYFWVSPAFVYVVFQGLRMFAPRSNSGHPGETDLKALLEAVRPSWRFVAARIDSLDRTHFTETTCDVFLDYVGLKFPAALDQVWEDDDL